MAAVDSVTPLEASDFAGYFAALWGGTPPFPWQQDLLDLLIDQRRWPRQIDLPTGAGKTSVIDIAVFLLAIEAELPASERWHPRRIALVVDRRVIVDQADDRAAEIASHLALAESGVLRTVADRLRSLAVGPDGQLPETPIAHTVLRGGIVRDESWAHRPDVPAIISSTVDQVGSRLLFRGYGVSRSMRPIHAGLLSNDVLYLLDEVHLAQPFADTLHQVDAYRTGSNASGRLPDRWQIAQLSATPGDTDKDRFPLIPLTGVGSPVLARRLKAQKPAELVEVKVAADPAKARERLAAECVARAMRLLADGARTVAVIVNRVDTARRVRALLRSRDTDACVITGRMRPVDRDKVLERVIPRVSMGRTRSLGDPPLVVVATQSIEAGADFDLDAIVTECASLDALRQRFGRVDRDGRLSAEGAQLTSVIVAGSTSVAADAVDPVYGTSLQATWAWLRSVPHVDFGIHHLTVPTEPSQFELLLPPRQRAPHLLPSHLDRWVQTSEYGVSADPDVAHWLHGIEATAQAEDVSVVWRDDLDPGLLRHAKAVDSLRAEVIGRVNTCPPVADEALPVPLSAVRAWLADAPDAAAPEVADVYLDDAPMVERPRRSPDDPVVVRWRDDQAELVQVSEIEPGDTIVVPCAFGGLEHDVWSPVATTSVNDVHDIAVPGTTVLRLSRARFDRLPESPTDLPDHSDPTDLTDLGGNAEQEPRPAPVFPDPDQLADLTPSERRTAVETFLRGWLELNAGAPQAARVRQVVDGGLTHARLLPFAESGEPGAVRRTYVVVGLQSRARRRSAFGDDDGRDSTSFGGERVTLTDHLTGVSLWAAQLAANLGLDDDLVEELTRAGRWHDLGKLDPRFQQWLHGGDAWRVATGSPPLAKSITVLDPVSRRSAQQRSGYPQGLRHELLSVTLAPHDASELVRHLVASHHGRARYRFAAQPEVEVAEVGLDLADEHLGGPTRYDLDRLDSGVAERFWSQVRQWGWFGLAWLEAVLRLADHEDSRSGAPSNRTGGR